MRYPANEEGENFVGSLKWKLTQAAKLWVYPKCVFLCCRDGDTRDTMLQMPPIDATIFPATIRHDYPSKTL